MYPCKRTLSNATINPLPDASRQLQHIYLHPLVTDGLIVDCSVAKMTSSLLELEQ